MKKSPKFSPEVRERAVRMVQEHRAEYPSQWAAIESIAEKIGCVPQTLHTWVRQHEVDAGQRDGVSTADAQRIKDLERENRELRKANEILKLASAFFAQAELDRRIKSRRTSSTIIASSLGSSRSAVSCRSPHPRTGSMLHASGNQPCARCVLSVMQSWCRRFNVCGTPTCRSMVQIRSGFSSTGKMSAWRAAPSSG